MLIYDVVNQGDQASIIGGAIEFVRELEQLLQCLESQKRRRMNTTNTNDHNMANTVNPTIDMHSISNGPDTLFLDDGIDEEKIRKNNIILENINLEDMSNVDASSRMGMDMQTMMLMMMMKNNNNSNTLHQNHIHDEDEDDDEDMDMGHDHSLYTSGLLLPHREDNDYYNSNNNNVSLGLQCMLNDGDGDEVVVGSKEEEEEEATKKKKKKKKKKKVVVVAHAKSRLVDIEVKMIDAAQQLVVIKILSQRRPRQLLHTVTALHTHLHLLILHTNVTTIDNTVLYSFSVKVVAFLSIIPFSKFITYSLLTY